MMLIGDGEIIGDDLLDILLLPYGPTGSSGFDVETGSMLSFHSGAKKFLVGTANADRSYGRSSEKRGFSLFLLITDWSTASVLADLILFRRPGLAGSKTQVSYGGLQESCTVLGIGSADLSCGRM
jgi:hypothetical protein